MLDHLDDIASDLSAFHRIDDMTVLSGPVWCKLVWRLPAYAGVLQSRALAQEQSDNQARGSGPAHRAEQINPGTQATLRADPAFAGLISFG